MSGRPSCKESLIDAAEAVVAEHGAAHLTLDAVAEKAGVSKGGLLYHFPTKESLLQGMIERLLDRFNTAREEILRKSPKTPSARLEAHIRAAFGHGLSHKPVSTAVLAAGANDPRLLDPVRKRIAEDLRGLCANRSDCARVLVVLLATDGLWLNEQLETLPLDARLKQQVLDELISLARSTTPAP